jgi:hypothetical protein
MSVIRCRRVQGLPPLAADRPGRQTIAGGCYEYQL